SAGTAGGFSPFPPFLGREGGFPPPGGRPRRRRPLKKKAPGEKNGGGGVVFCERGERGAACFGAVCVRRGEKDTERARAQRAERGAEQAEGRGSRREEPRQLLVQADEIAFARGIERGIHAQLGLVAEDGIHMRPPDRAITHRIESKLFHFESGDAAVGAQSLD